MSRETIENVNEPARTLDNLIPEINQFYSSQVQELDRLQVREITTRAGNLNSQAEIQFFHAFFDRKTNLISKAKELCDQGKKDSKKIEEEFLQLQDDISLFKIKQVQTCIEKQLDNEKKKNKAPLLSMSITQLKESLRFEHERTAKGLKKLDEISKERLEFLEEYYQKLRNIYSQVQDTSNSSTAAKTDSLKELSSNIRKGIFNPSQKPLQNTKQFITINIALPQNTINIPANQSNTEIKDVDKKENNPEVENVDIKSEEKEEDTYYVVTGQVYIPSDVIIREDTDGIAYMYMDNKSDKKLEKESSEDIEKRKENINKIKRAEAVEAFFTAREKYTKKTEEYNGLLREVNTSEKGHVVAEEHFSENATIDEIEEKTKKIQKEYKNIKKRVEALKRVEKEKSEYKTAVQKYEKVFGELPKENSSNTTKELEKQAKNKINRNFEALKLAKTEKAKEISENIDELQKVRETLEKENKGLEEISLTINDEDLIVSAQKEETAKALDIIMEKIDEKNKELKALKDLSEERLKKIAVSKETTELYIESDKEELDQIRKAKFKPQKEILPPAVKSHIDKLVTENKQVIEKYQEAIVLAYKKRLQGIFLELNAYVYMTYNNFDYINFDNIPHNHPFNTFLSHGILGWDVQGLGWKPKNNKEELEALVNALANKTPRLSIDDVEKTLEIFKENLKDVLLVDIEKKQDKLKNLYKEHHYQDNSRLLVKENRTIGQMLSTLKKLSELINEVEQVSLENLNNIKRNMRENLKKLKKLNPSSKEVLKKVEKMIELIDKIRSPFLFPFWHGGKKNKWESMIFEQKEIMISSALKINESLNKDIEEAELAVQKAKTASVSNNLNNDRQKLLDILEEACQTLINGLESNENYKDDKYSVLDIKNKINILRYPSSENKPRQNVFGFFKEENPVKTLAKEVSKMQQKYKDIVPMGTDYLPWDEISVQGVSIFVKPQEKPQDAVIANFCSVK